ncbi:response regulator [Streptomyces flavofungini]|uniref:response regulator n=1 Tax=Streptomyces flavofungini TaxID=68200 RepID=UPI0034DFF860
MPTDSVILLVDDHIDTLFALESALAPLGHPMASVTNGDDALKAVLHGNVGLILLDVRMPGVSGLDVVRYVHRLDLTRFIPIILLTAFDISREVLSAAALLGVADVSVKPIDPLTLRTKVRYLFETHQRIAALRQELDDLRARLNDAPLTPARIPPPVPPATTSHPPDARSAGSQSQSAGG